MAWWGAATERVKLGTGIIQMSARTPAATAMAAITLDHLSNGRFILGLGASGPQVVEGWYGQPYPKPLARTREYVDVVRKIVARDAPVEHHGAFYDMPFQGGAGLGKALKSTVHPLRNEIPIYLAAEGPKNVALSAEICDGWMPLFFSPKEDKFYRDCLQQGFDAAGDPTKADRFEVTATLMLIPGDDAEKCADMVRPMLALYAGGMGAKGANFHYEVFARMGYEDVADKVQELYLQGRKQEAAAAIPLAMVEDVALVGPARQDPRRTRQVARDLHHGVPGVGPGRGVADLCRPRARLNSARPSPSFRVRTRAVSPGCRRRAIAATRRAPWPARPAESTRRRPRRAGRGSRS